MTSGLDGYFPRKAIGIGILMIVLICAAMLALPGRTVTAAFTNDVLIFLDGAHRISWGQLPNRDFHSALGPLVFYIPAMGYWMTGDLGAAMPVGMAMLLLALAAPMLHILQSRLRMPIALALGAFLILILAAPLNLGSAMNSLTFAMFYNRIGWVGLGLLLVMYLRPREISQIGSWADAVASALLLLLQFYTKATYGVVSLAFLALMLFDRLQRNWVLACLLLTVAGAVIVELAWQGSWQYVADLMAAAQVSGERNLATVIRSALNNLADLTVFAIAAGVLLWRSRSLRDLLFFGFCAAAGLLILSQNAHGWGILTLYVGVAVATEMAFRLGSALPADAPSGEPLSATHGLPLLLAFFLLPPVIHHASAVVLHAKLAVTNAGTSLQLPKLENLRLVPPGASPKTFMNRYHQSIADGGQLLQSLAPPPQRVVVLDFVNPFSAGLGLRPPTGDSAWLHWGRNVNEKSHLPADVLLADAEIVMIPKVGINSAPLQTIYGPFIRTEFAFMRETDDWIVYRRRDTGAAQ